MIPVLYPPNGFRTRCPQCGADIVTITHHTPNLRTHLVALFLCIVFCWPCSCIPYFMSDCYDIHHYCPLCDAYIGVHPGLI